jgi:hypothetical protein
MCRARFVPLQPKEFKKVLMFPHKVGCLLPIVYDFRLLDQVTENIAAVRLTTKFPWPLTDRLMCNLMYYSEDQPANEIIWIASARENDEYRRTSITEADTKKLVVGSTNIAGYYVRPVRD